MKNRPKVLNGKHQVNQRKIDNCCSHSLTNSKEDFIEPPVKSKVRVRGYNGHTNSTMVGTLKWKVQDGNGKVS
jgi:hypothetical protein